MIKVDYILSLSIWCR